MTLLNEFKDFILEVNFTSSIDGDVSRQGQNASKLLSWKFINFTQFYLDLEVNFTNPLLISKGGNSDAMVSIIKNKALFVSKESGAPISGEHSTFANPVPR